MSVGLVLVLHGQIVLRCSYDASGFEREQDFPDVAISRLCQKPELRGNGSSWKICALATLSD